jgi:hypothetical protein
MCFPFREQQIYNNAAIEANPILALFWGFWPDWAFP